MSDKERRTVSLSKEADQVLDAEDNVSAVVDDLVKQYGRTGDRGAAGLKLRRSHKLDDLEEARRKVERLERQVEELTKLIKEREQTSGADWDKAREVLGRIEPDDLTAENAAVQHWSEKLGVTTSELLSEIEGGN